MKNNKTPIVVLTLLGAAAAFMYFRNKKAAGENLRFEPVDIAIDSAKTRAALFARLYYRVKLRLINSERASVNVQKVLLNVSANGRDLGTLTSNQGFSVPAQGAQVVALETSISTFGTAATIIELIRNREPVVLNVAGYVDTDLGRVTVNYNQGLQIWTAK